MLGGQSEGGSHLSHNIKRVCYKDEEGLRRRSLVLFADVV
jgi:hypothetical protein